MYNTCKFNEEHENCNFVSLLISTFIIEQSSVDGIHKYKVRNTYICIIVYMKFIYKYSIVFNIHNYMYIC